MKKIILSALTVLLFTAAASANIFTDRIFEVRANANVDFSNNSITLDDLLQKELVIDLEKLADNMPSDGFICSTNSTPDAEVTFNIGIFKVSTMFGVDGYGRLQMSDDIFNFIGKGNELGEAVTTKLDITGDAFAFFGVNLAANIGPISFEVAPVIFSPVAHVVSSGNNFVIQNTTDGTLYADVTAKGTVYSNVVKNGSKYDFLPLFQGLGLDVQGSIRYKFTPLFDLIGYARTPLIPGHLNYKSDLDLNFHYNETALDMARGNAGTPTFTENWNNFQSAEYYINRPVKLHAGIVYHPFGSLLEVTAKGGVRITNPFSSNQSEVVCSPEYAASAELNVFGLYKVGFSMDYLDQVFTNKFFTSLNLRFVELDFAAALQSPTFQKSFSGEGMSIYVGAAFGF